MMRLTLEIVGKTLFSAEVGGGAGVLRQLVAQGGHLPDDELLALARRMTPGERDELLLRVSAEAPGPVSIDRVEVSYRDGLQWATEEAGHPVRVNVLGR